MVVINAEINQFSFFSRSIAANLKELCETLDIPEPVSVNTVEACPLLLVVVEEVLSDCPDAPVGTEAIAKLTPTPDTGLPPASITVTTNGFARAALIGFD